MRRSLPRDTQSRRLAARLTIIGSILILAAPGSADQNEARWGSTIEWRPDLSDSGDRESSANSATDDASHGGLVEAILGTTYLPLDDDQLDLLFEHTYFPVPPSPSGIGRSDVTLPFEQRSHVLSFDATGDETESLAMGRKHRLQIGEPRVDGESDAWFESAAHLGVVRMDWNLIEHWDIFAESRMLRIEETEDVRSGALIGVYRRLGGGLRLGVGYNFNQFLDSFTNRDHDHDGWFINLAAEF